ncbi:MAG TPA: hypothetical protein VK453_20845 [Micromonosporaceae bacterium]|nr:hypothetical protein [Micromonosporaceae bacterium]
MDALDRVAAPARDLLGRVDATLVALGAPDQPQLWELLSRVGALPGGAFEFVAELRPAPMTVAADHLRDRADGYRQECAALAGNVDETIWQGAGHEAFTSRWRALAGYLDPEGVGAGPDPDSMAGRMRLLASYLDAVADWVVDTRHEVARTLAAALSSAEAVRLRAAARAAGAEDVPTDRSAATAAAALAWAILSAVDDTVARGRQLHGAWAPRLGRVDYRPAADPGGYTPTIVSA